MLKCKSLLDFFKFNSESEILIGPDHSEPSVSGLPVTCVSYESESMDDDADTDSDLEAVYMHVYLNQHLMTGVKPPRLNFLTLIH